MLLEESLMKFILGISKEIKLEGETGVTRSIIDQLYSSDIHGDQMEFESVVIGSMIDELDSSDFQGDQMEGESGVTRSIMDELHS